MGAAGSEWEGEERSESGSRAPLWRLGKGRRGSVGAKEGEVKVVVDEVQRPRRAMLSRVRPRVLAHFLGFRPSP